MGNQAVKPYIVDDLDSDQDDPETCYDTAPETDLHDPDDDPDLDPAKKVSGDGKVKVKAEARRAGGRKKMSVDAAIVTSLVANVEELLGHLSNHDYQAAHSAAMMLKSCGIGSGGGGSDANAVSSGLNNNTGGRGLSEEECRTLADLEREILLMNEDDKDSGPPGSHPEPSRSTLLEQEGGDRGDRGGGGRGAKTLLLQSHLSEVKVRQASRSPARSGIPTLHRSTSGGRWRARSPPGTSRLPVMTSQTSGSDGGHCDPDRERRRGRPDGGPERKHKVSGGMRWGEAGSASLFMAPCRDDVTADSREGVTLDILMQRRVLDLRRWMCMPRPQYKTACAVSCLVSCWNYLYSTIGNGGLRPTTQEEVLSILGFPQPYDNVRFGAVTSNTVLLRWFQQLNEHYGVSGRCGYLYKPRGKNSTAGVTSEEALWRLKEGLKDCHSAFVYHCHNHYFSPLGYEDVPRNTPQAYSGALLQNEVETWILIGDSSDYHPSIHCKRWADISIDLNCQSPEYLDIRRDWKGLQRHHDPHHSSAHARTTGGNLHCILEFHSSGVPCTRSPTTTTSHVPRLSGLPVRRPGGASGGSPEMAEGGRGASWSAGEEEVVSPAWEEESCCESEEDLDSDHLNEDIQ